MTASRTQARAVLVSIACVVLALVPASGPLAAVAACLVLGLLPGWALTRYAQLDPLGRGVVAVAASLALSVLVSIGLMYSGLWTPQTTLVCLTALAVAVHLAPARAREVQ